MQTLSNINYEPQITFNTLCKSLSTGKTERFVWILVVFPQPWLIPIFFQPFFIKMAPARHCDIQLNPQNKYRNARKRELEHTCKPDMRCALVAQRRCARVTREHWERKQAFLRILWACRGCYTLFTWTFVFTGFHLLENLKVLKYFSIFFNKKSRTFKDQNQFQVLSRS